MGLFVLAFCIDITPFAKTSFYIKEKLTVIINMTSFVKVKQQQQSHM